jgi:uncharacterized protein
MSTHHITTLVELDNIYAAPNEASTAKEVSHLTAHYRQMIEASPFVTLATCGPEGLDCSPRGDKQGVVRIQDERTLLLPDRRGNNRADSLRNIVRDPRVALLFLIPGSGNTLRVNGRAVISVEPELLRSFAVDEAAPRSVAVITIETVFFQCARALLRSSLWDAASQVDPASLPTPGQILAALTGDRVGGQAYDQAWPDRAKATMW